MPALVIFVLFTTMLSLVGALAINSGVSSAQLSAQRTEETQQFMRNVRAVVLNELTANQLRAASAAVTDGATFLQNTPAIRQLAAGIWADPARDAWGRAMRVYLVVENMALTGQVTVPVTGVGMVSAGSNGIYETAAVTPTTLTGLMGVLPPVGSDDIVLTFNDLAAQQHTFEKIDQSMRAIGSRVMRQYQMQYKDYLRTMSASMTTTISGTPTLDSLQMEQTIRSDANSAKFIVISDTTNARALGIEDDLNYVQQAWPSPQADGSTITGGNFVADSVLNADNSLTLRLRNGTRPTPWTMNLSFTLERGM